MLVFPTLLVVFSLVVVTRDDRGAPLKPDHSQVWSLTQKFSLNLFFTVPLEKAMQQ